MKISIDREKVNARASAANFASIGGLLALLVSVVLPLFVAPAANYTWIVSIAGAAIAMLGIYLANRWVRKPRPEDSLDRALRSFDDRFHIFHYPDLPCEHVLLTPSGIMAFDVVNLDGSFSFRDGRWKEAMTIGRALRYIVEPRVVDPRAFAQNVEQELGDRFRREFGAEFVVPIRGLTVFTHPGSELEVQGSALPACKPDKLRKQVPSNASKLPAEIYDKLESFIDRVTRA